MDSFQTSGNSPGGSGCRIGLLGFGTVGAALARRLTGPDSPPILQLTHIYDRRAREKRGRQPQSIEALTWIDQFDDLLTSDTDIIVEATAGSEPVFDYIRAALLAGKSVVSANKMVVAHQGPALLGIAERQGRQFRFDAAVGGAMPIVRALEGLAGERISALDAILSGSCNDILSRVERTGCDIGDAIAEACARGYAEADPAADLDGSDAAAKLAILCGIAFGLRVTPSQIDVRSAGRLGAESFQRARKRDGTIRQIAHAEFDGDRSALTAWVAPMVVPSASLFARVEGPGNAVVIKGNHAGEVVLSGTGAGSDAVAVGLVGDLMTIARDRAAIVPAPILKDPQTVRGLADYSFAEAV
jgi:homoserine dehydrogenase